MLAQAGQFLPDDLAGWLGVIAAFAVVVGLGWRAVNRIVNAIDNIAAIPAHAEQIAALDGKVDDLDDGQIAVLSELRDIKTGMVTAAEMTTHTHQDAAQFDRLDRRLGTIDGRLGRVEDHVGIERTSPEVKRDP